MGDVIGPVILGIIISILGISNMKGNISSLHWYHRPLHLLEVGKNTIFTTLSQGNTVEQMISGILFLYYAPIIKPSLILGGRDIDF